MTKYAIVTCISKPEVYQSCLLDSLTKCRRGFDIEIIPVFNTTGQYPASVALNYGMSVTDADVVIFSHQDITLLDGWFQKLDDAVQASSDWAIIGASGIRLSATRDDIGGWGGPRSSDTKIAVGTVYSDNGLEWDGIEVLTPVHTVDECLFALNRSAGLKFDTTMGGFHLYGTDIALQARNAGFGVYAASLPLIHHNTYSSSLKDSYWPMLHHMFHKWRKPFPEVLGTFYHWAMVDGAPEIVGYIGHKMRLDDYLINIKCMKVGRVL